MHLVSIEQSQFDGVSLWIFLNDSLRVCVCVSLFSMMPPRHVAAEEPEREADGLLLQGPEPPATTHKLNN